MMRASIRRSAVAALLALVVLFGTTQARAQVCPNVTVINNTGLAIIFAMYDNAGNALVPSTMLAVGGSTMVRTTSTIGTPPATYIAMGFVNWPATGLSVGSPVPTSQQVTPGVGPCSACFHVTLANGAKGPCVIACGNNANCTVTISLAPQCTTC